MERKRSEAAIRDLLLDLAARPHEDGGGAGLVDRNAGRGDLSAPCTPQLDQLAMRIDHC